MTSSEKRDTSLAAQNASSGRIWSKAGFGYSGRHLIGSKTSPSKRPTDFAPSQYLVRIHGRTYRPNVASVLNAGAHSRMYSLPARSVCGDVLPLPMIEPKSNM